MLVREYQGERHTVTVIANGFVWREATYASLSTIARAITGTNWNGPRFFGLRIDKETTVSPDTADAPPRFPNGGTLAQAGGSKSRRVVAIERPRGNATPPHLSLGQTGFEPQHALYMHRPLTHGKTNEKAPYSSLSESLAAISTSAQKASRCSVPLFSLPSGLGTFRIRRRLMSRGVRRSRPIPKQTSELHHKQSCPACLKYEKYIHFLGSLALAPYF